jgi:hypothetical protein
MPTKWKGGAANRTWGRQGYVAPITKGDQARGRRLYALLAYTPFWCETCGRQHPLSEHRECRTGQVTEPLPGGLGGGTDQA